MEIITSVNLNGVRDMMFLNNGNTLVVASTTNSRLQFFNRSDNFSTGHDLQYQKLLHYLSPHGLFRVNDTFFYRTSWGNNTVWSYAATENTTQWDENRFVNVTPALPTGSGSHITVDDCGRWWFSLYSYVLQIFENTCSIFCLRLFWFFDNLIVVLFHHSDEKANVFVF